ncbi:MAG: hypothetical protein MJY62_03030 [Bacteroidales bacterium]|nr:hypothetical protein [Bacteroidales bacterium]
MSRKSLALCLLGVMFLCLLIAGAVRLLYSGHELVPGSFASRRADTDTTALALPAVPEVPATSTVSAAPKTPAAPKATESFSRTVRLLGKDYVLNQTKDNVLHACDSSGKPLWDLKIGGPIDGTVGIVDFYSNGKQQFMFTSGRKLYVVDRLGRFVEGFPMELIPLE